MREILRLSLAEPNPGKVLDLLGIPEGHQIDDRTQRMIDDAFDIYRNTATPVGILDAILMQDFAALYEAESNNEPQTPLGQIFGHAENLALFAVTVGEKVSREIERLFEETEFALASVLDSVASAGTEAAADVVESRFAEVLLDDCKLDDSKGTLRFSPGYCGWHISGQRKLFEHLRPGEIGITLRESFLMEPLKSISGVIVSGKKTIFNFDDSYPFCAECETRSCRDRIKQVMEQTHRLNRNGEHHGAAKGNIREVAAWRFRRRGGPHRESD